MSQNELVSNPFAPPVFEGIVGRTSEYVDTAYTYVYNIALTASQVLLGQLVSLDRDADFLLLAIQLVDQTSVNFSVQFSDNQGQNFSNDFVSGGIFGAYPFAWVPGRIFAAGGKIGINIRDNSAAPNTIQLAFRGLKRYRL